MKKTAIAALLVAGTFAAGLTGAASIGRAEDDEGLQMPKIESAAVVKECGACHMAFQPEWLPKRSWEALMGKLEDHFGEVATVPESTRTEILAYLVAHAADAPGSPYARWMLRRLKDTEVPLRITELPSWKRAHHELSAKSFTKPKVKTASNCVACHAGAAKGWFEDD